MGQATDTTGRIRDMLRQHGRMANVDGIATAHDLYAAGLTSFAAVQVMLALEEACDVEFPERMLNRRSFASIDAIAGCLREIAPRRAAA